MDINNRFAGITVDDQKSGKNILKITRVERTRSNFIIT